MAKKDTKSTKKAGKISKPSKPAKVAVKVAVKAAVKTAKPAAKAGGKSSAKAPAKTPKAAKTATGKPVATKVVPPSLKAKPSAKGVVPVKEEKKKPAVTAKADISVSPDLVEDRAEEEVVLTNADGQRYCRNGECDELATTDGYCRFHYLLNWKKIQFRKKILMDNKLERYVEELTSRYPDKFVEIIRKDLLNEKDFLAVIQELEIDGSGEDEEFEDESKIYIEEVRGVTSAGEEESDF